MICIFRTAVLVLSIWLVAQLAASPVHAQADGPDGAEYERAVRQGLQEYRHGNFAEMYAAMRRAHQLEPNARTLRGMGVAAFELRDYVAALQHLRAALAHTRKPLTPALRSEVEDMLDRAEMYVDTVEVELDPPDAVLSVNGKPPVRDEGGKLLLALGRHELVASLDGYESAKHVLQVTGGISHRVSLELSAAAPLPDASSASTEAAAASGTLTAAAERIPRDEPGATQRTLGYVALASAAALAVGTGIAFALRQSAAAEYNSDACMPLRSVKCADEADQVETMETLAIAGAASAGAFAITGAILLLTAAQPERDDSSACRPAGAGVLCSVAF